MSDLYLYNTMSRKKEKFVPLRDNYVKMYNCGPTVYSTPHIGNYRSFLLADLLRRFFDAQGLYGGQDRYVCQQYVFYVL